MFYKRLQKRPGKIECIDSFHVIDLMEKAWVQRGWQRRMFVHVGILRYVVLIVQKFARSLHLETRARHEKRTANTHTHTHAHTQHKGINIPHKVQSLIVLFF